MAESQPVPDQAKAEIAVIAPYPALAEAAAAAAAEIGLPVVVQVGDLEEGAWLAESLRDQGIKVFVSRGGTAGLLRVRGLQVTEVYVGARDLLEGLRELDGRPEARAGPIGLIGFENILAGAHRLARLLSIDLRARIIRSESEVPDNIQALKLEGVQVVLGDQIVASLAPGFGLAAGLIQSGPDAVAAAVREARERLRLLTWAEETQRRGRLEVLSQFKTVLDALEEPVLILDRSGRIQNRNRAAAELSGGDTKDRRRREWAALPAFGRALQSGRPQVDQLLVLNGRRFLVDFHPIGPTGVEGETAAPLIAALARTAEKIEAGERRLRQSAYLKGHVARWRLGDIITEDPSFKAFLDKAAEYAHSDSAIVIQGESGTGKEMLAQSLHNLKFEAAAPFVAINCAALPAGLLESELFGYAPGAFTGALKEGKKGYFELAHNGTLFLDEVGEMPLELQGRLLRAIEERAILPVGADRLVPVKARLLAATNLDLAEAVRRGRFRRDLYFRLGVLFLAVPPLRARGRDPLALFQRLAAAGNPELSPARLAGPELSGLLLSHTWPGNARELKNLVERLSIITRGFTRRLKEIPALLAEELAGARLAATPPAAEAPPGASRLAPLQEALRRPSKADLARELGISRSTLWRRLKGLTPPPHPPARGED